MAHQRRLLMWVTALAAVVTLALPAGLAAAKSTTAQGSTQVALRSVMGLTLTRVVHTPDGLIAASWKSKSGQRLYYLGPPGDKLSLVRHAVSKQKGKKVITRTWYTVAVHSSGKSSALMGAYANTTAGHRAALTRADATRGGFPNSVVKSFAKQVSQQPRSCGSNCNIITSTCLSYFDAVNVSVNACDNRYKLQQATGNNYLADDANADIAVGSYLGVALTRVNDWYSYNTSTATVVALNPDESVVQQTNCSSLGTWSVTYKGVGFTSHIETCAGKASTWGLTQNKGGDSWNGNLYDTPSSTLRLDPIIEVHNTYQNHVNPDSTFHVTTVTTATTVAGQCANGTTCG